MSSTHEGCLIPFLLQQKREAHHDRLRHTILKLMLAAGDPVS